MENLGYLTKQSQGNNRGARRNGGNEDERSMRGGFKPGSNGNKGNMARDLMSLVIDDDDYSEDDLSTLQ